MKTLQAFIFSFLLISFTQVSFAQTSQRDTINVSGECGMCKKKIETAAKGAGVQFASWNIESKKLVISYSPAATNASKIQQAIAAVGYDTPEIKASEAAYKSLHECCQYERTASNAKENCCADGKCAKDEACCTSGKCNKTADCCSSNAGCCTSDACANSAAKKA